MLLLCASCSIVLALLAKWVPIGIEALLHRQSAPAPAFGSSPELIYQSPPSPPPPLEPSFPPPPKQQCPVLFDGDLCKKQKPLPKCMDTTFRGSFTLGSWVDNDLGDEVYLSDEIIALLPSEVRLPSLFFALVGCPTSEPSPRPLIPQDVFGRKPGSHKVVPSCALVSNGALLRGKGLGPKIDANTYVLRLNNAPTKGYEASACRHQ